MDKAPVRSKPFFKPSTKVKSSCPASRMSRSKGQSLLSFTTFAIQGLRDAFSFPSSSKSSVARMVHLLTCSVGALATW